MASLLVCFATWFVIEKTRLGAYLRAGTENPRLVEAFGVNVPLMITLTYAFGCALAAFAGVLAAPVMQVSPLMGQNLIIVVFAVVVDRRHGLDHGRHPHRPGPRRDRGLHQGLLPRRPPPPWCS